MIKKNILYIFYILNYKYIKIFFNKNFLDKKK